MATVNVDLAAVKAALTGTETGRMKTRGTNADEQFGVAERAITDLNAALQAISNNCDAGNIASLLTIQQKLLP